MTPPPAEDKKIGARDKVKGERLKGKKVQGSRSKDKGTRGKGESFYLTVDLFVDYRLDKLLNWFKTT